MASEAERERIRRLLDDVENDDHTDSVPRDKVQEMELPEAKEEAQIINRPLKALDHLFVQWKNLTEKSETYVTQFDNETVHIKEKSGKIFASYGKLNKDKKYLNCFVGFLSKVPFYDFQECPVLLKLVKNFIIYHKNKGLSAKEIMTIMKGLLSDASTIRLSTSIPLSDIQTFSFCLWTLENPSSYSDLFRDFCELLPLSIRTNYIDDFDQSESGPSHQ